MRRIGRASLTSSDCSRSKLPRATSRPGFRTSRVTPQAGPVGLRASAVSRLPGTGITPVRRWLALVRRARVEETVSSPVDHGLIDVGGLKERVESPAARSRDRARQITVHPGSLWLHAAARPSLQRRKRSWGCSVKVTCTYCIAAWKPRVGSSRVQSPRHLGRPQNANVDRRQYLLPLRASVCGKREVRCGLKHVRSSANVIRRH
jgi:hypothetical protein